MTIAIAGWNTQKIFLGSDGRLNVEGKILTDSLQKIVLHEDRGFAFVAHGDWDFSNGNTIRMVIEEFIEAEGEDESHSFDQYCSNFHVFFCDAYDFMQTGFFICGTSGGSSCVYQIGKGGDLQRLPEVGLVYNATPRTKGRIREIYESSFQEVLGKNPNSFNFGKRISDKKFAQIIRDTLHRVYIDEVANHEGKIGDSFDLAKITSDRTEWILNTNTPFRKLSEVHP